MITAQITVQAVAGPANSEPPRRRCNYHAPGFGVRCRDRRRGPVRLAVRDGPDTADLFSRWSGAAWRVGHAGFSPTHLVQTESPERFAACS